MKFSTFNALLCSLAFFFCASCSDSKPNSFISGQGAVWNTTYSVSYRGPQSLLDSVTAVLADLDTTLNVFNPNSLVSVVNRQDSTPVNTDFIRVYVMSRKVNSLTHGAFDPTLGPLIRAWGFGPGHQATADTARIDSIMTHVGIEKTHLAHDALIKDHSDIEFNFSAIAKGYACDCVAEMFERNGVTDYLVEIGGEIMAKGSGPSGSEWRVSIDRPILSDSILHDSQTVIKFTDRGVATSGNYRNFKRDGSRIYGHTISSKTGRPAETDVLSATVVARNAMEADALATSMMAMGSRDGKDLAKKLRLPVMLILSDSTIYTTPQFDALILTE